MCVWVCVCVGLCQLWGWGTTQITHMSNQTWLAGKIDELNAWRYPAMSAPHASYFCRV